jgi:2,3-bisphosphoglycerate-independent phosphoglycerate mutase
MNAPRTLLVFVDGLGLGPGDPSVNPVHGGACPVLEGLLGDAAPVDACLGVPGLPQSATGQATLLTGVNAAALVGRHMEGLPGPRLKELVREHNLFSQLSSRGYRATFANAYFTDDIEEVKQRRRQSVTTVAALHAFGAVRDTAKMLENRAVYQDLTREFLKTRGYTGPTVAPRESAEHLLAIAEEHDFTLFEYFQTDLMAHKGAAADVRRVLGQLDEFLSVLLPFAERPGRLFILTSDHGNLEDMTTRVHTQNPVPLVVLGQGADILKSRVRSLADFVPALLGFYPAGKPGA